MRYADRLDTAKQWRESARRGRLSLRQPVIEVTGRKQFVGAPVSVALEIERHVQEDAADGFVFAPHVTPGASTHSWRR